MDSMNEDWKSRTKRMIGDEGLAKLEQSRVAVFGLGGVGSSCVESLARAGVGHFLLVDKDEVDPSNINRQAIAFHSTVGERKVDAMRNMVLDINPDAQVDVLDAFIKRESIDEQLAPFACHGTFDGSFSDGMPGSGEYSSSGKSVGCHKLDYIVDAFDTLTAKLAIVRYAEEHGIPSISAMGSANKLDPTRFEFADLFDTHICPMCREMRKIARDAGIEHMQVIYSSEHPQKVKPQEGAQRREKTELGTMPYLPPIMGQMMASYVIRDLLGMLHEC